jgi:hypothetical protein
MSKLEILIISCAPFARLEACLNSVVCAQLAAKRSDLIHVLAQGDADIQQLERLRRNFPEILLQTQNVVNRPGRARNLLLRKVVGELVHFIDDDVEVPEKYYVHLFQLLQSFPKAIAFGGPDLGMEKQSAFQGAASSVMASYFGTGPSCYRYSMRAARRARETHLTTASLVLRGRTALEKLFPEAWIAGEESVFLSQVSDLGEMIYSPSLFVRHHRRTDPLLFAKQFLRYGQGRGYCLRRGNPWTFLHLLPFVGALLFLWFGLMALFAYIVLDVLFVLEIAIRERAFNLVHLISCFLLFPFLHFCYLLGMIRGMVSSAKIISG